MWHSKGDVEAEHLLIEAKTTKAPEYRVKVATLSTIRMQAKKRGKEPVLCVRFETDASPMDFALIRAGYIEEGPPSSPVYVVKDEELSVVLHLKRKESDPWYFSFLLEGAGGLRTRVVYKLVTQAELENILG